VNVNAITSNGRTPLRLAIQYNNIAAFDAIMARTDLNLIYTLETQGWTYLHIARSNPYMLRALLQRGVIDVNAKDVKKMTVLHLAASVSDVEVTDVLLSHPGIDVNSKDIVGMSPLHRALCNRNTVIAEKLIEFARTNINLRSRKGVSPIYLAITGNLPECVRALCRRADLDLRTGTGTEDKASWSPLALATFHRRVAIIEILLQCPGMKMKSKRYGVKHANRVAKEDELGDCLQVLKHGRCKKESQKELFPAEILRRKRSWHL
jgi:ankyrin repeat protein